MGETRICVALCAVLIAIGCLSSGYFRSAIYDNFDSDNPAKSIGTMVFCNGIPSTPLGSTTEEGLYNVFSVCGGTVIDIKHNTCYSITIKNGDGTTSNYSNLKSILVVCGQAVQNGQQIGTYSEEYNKEFHYSIT